MRLFQNALEERNKKKEKLEVRLSEADSARLAAEKKAEEAKMALLEHKNKLPELKKEYIRMGIQFYANEVVKELAKDYHAGYEFALDKLNIPSDHELKVA